LYTFHGYFPVTTQCARLSNPPQFNKPPRGTLIVDAIGKLLPVLFKKQMRRAEPHLLEILVPLWPRIVGKTMAQHSRPAHFDLGALTLYADCPTWGTQLRHMTEEIRTKVNGFLGQAIVKKLRIKTVTQPDLFSPARRASRIAPPGMPADLAMATEAIADPEVAATLANSYAKYFHRTRS
jgi:hypothetical protein